MKRAFWLVIGGIWLIFVVIAWLTADYRGGMDASFMMMLCLIMSHVDGLKEEIGEMPVHNSKIVCYNATKEKGQQMDAKKCKDGSWVVEVRKVDTDGGEFGDWFRISECADGQTAVAIADALHNFMGCGIAGDELRTQTQVRMTEHKDGFDKRS